MTSTRRSRGSAAVANHQFQGLLAGHIASQAMSSHCPSVAPGITLRQLVDKHVLGGGRRCFLAVQGGRTLGMMTLHRIKEVPRSQWANTTAARVMHPMRELKSIGPQTDLWAALQLLDRDGVNQRPVMEGDLVVGMLSRDDAIIFQGTLQQLEPAPNRQAA